MYIIKVGSLFGAHLGAPIVREAGTSAPCASGRAWRCPRLLQGASILITVRTNMYTYIYIHVDIYIYICVCVYIQTYIYVHIHLHIHILLQ